MYIESFRRDMACGFSITLKSSLPHVPLVFTCSLLLLTIDYSLKILTNKSAMKSYLCKGLTFIAGNTRSNMVAPMGSLGTTLLNYNTLSSSLSNNLFNSTNSTIPL